MNTEKRALLGGDSWRRLSMYPRALHNKVRASISGVSERTKSQRLTRRERASINAAGKIPGVPCQGQGRADSRAGHEIMLPHRAQNL
jgi:hypothetical protein